MRDKIDLSALLLLLLLLSTAAVSHPVVHPGTSVPA
jgi:hypothetical protein